MLFQMTNRLSKVKRTADARTIFQRDDNYINPDTGKVEKGSWCTVCKYIALVIFFWYSRTNSVLGNGISIKASPSLQAACLHCEHTYLGK